jgi:hypothetical protein
VGGVGALQFAAMEVLNVRWVGVKTDRYEAMVGFLPGDPDYEFLSEHAAGPVLASRLPSPRT